MASTVFELFGSIFINNKDADKSLDDTTSKAERSGKRIKEAFKNIGSASLKIGKMVVGGAAAIGTAFAGTVESTRDYRTAMAKLDAAFVTNGHSSETALQTYKDLQSVLGDTDQAVEAANHLAIMCDSEKELHKWTDICTGVYATFGDSLPIEGLTESANETAKVGVVTGSLADALNWAGINEDDFNKKLKACTSEQERQDLIMNTLYWTYKSAGDQYKETAGDVMQANTAQDNLNSAMAKLGEIGEPIMTGLKNWVADMVNSAAPYLQTLIDKLANFDQTMATEVWPWIQKEAKMHFGMDLPDWETFKVDVSTWWSTTQTNIQNFCTWTLKIFDEPDEAVADAANAIKSWWDNTALPGISSVCQWYLALFGHPVESPEEISSYVKSWWLTVGDFVTGACEWTLKLFGVPKEDAVVIGEKMKAWWGTVAADVESACDWMLKCIGVEPWTKEDDEALHAWWTGVYDILSGKCTWKIPNPLDLTEADALATIAKIEAWWSTVVSRIRLTFGIIPKVQAANAAYQEDLTAAAGGSAVGGLLINNFTSNPDLNFNPSALQYLFSPNGSHAGGLDRVPYDGYIARVHKDESILNKEQADIWRGGGSERIESLLAQMIELIRAGQVIQLDSGIMAGQLTPAIDARLGVIQAYKERGN